jgi:hypothetical protein
MVPLVAYKRQRKPSSGRWLSFALILESFIDGTLLACNIPCRFEFFSYATLNKKSEPPQRGVGYYALVARNSINLCVFAIPASRFNHSSDLLVGGKKTSAIGTPAREHCPLFLEAVRPPSST